MNRTFAAGLLVIAFLSGCATSPRYVVHVDSIRAEPFVVKKRYVLLPGNLDTPANDLQFQEFSRYVKRALASMEYQEASSDEDLDIIILLAYGVGDPQERQYSYSVPVWGQTGVSSSYTSGIINSYGSSGTFSGTTTYTPTYGITGYQSRVGTLIAYFRFMVLDAIDFAESQKSQELVQLWKTTVTSTGSSGDIRKVFPALVAASRDYIGSNTGQRITVTLYENDSAILDIKAIRESP